LPLASCLEAPSPDQPGTPRRRSKPRTQHHIHLRPETALCRSGRWHNQLAAQLQLQTTSARPSVSTHARSTTTSSRPCGQPERLTPPAVALLADPSSAAWPEQQPHRVGAGSIGADAGHRLGCSMLPAAAGEPEVLQHGGEHAPFLRTAGWICILREQAVAMERGDGGPAPPCFSPRRTGSRGDHQNQSL